MIDIWFKNDLKGIFVSHSVAVLIDESGDAAFLLKCMEADCTVYHAESELEELHVKYLIEKARLTQPQPHGHGDSHGDGHGDSHGDGHEDSHGDGHGHVGAASEATGENSDQAALIRSDQNKFLIYTRTPKDRLKFIREYCEINGCLEIRYLQNYIKGKVHQALNRNLNLSREDLIAAAKLSVGKDLNYWIDICHKGATEIFDLKRELLPFLHRPEGYVNAQYDEKLRESFCRKVSDLIGQDYLEKPLATLAQEVVKAMLDGLAKNSCSRTLMAVYKQWLDSLSYRASFEDYLKDYSLPKDIDVWHVSVDHPFRQVDAMWLSLLGEALSKQGDLSSFSGLRHLDDPLSLLRQRHQSKPAKALNVRFWGDILTLLEFDHQNMAYLSSLDECVEFYQTHFCKLDRAIRHLYAEFLNQKKLLAPFQERYKAFLAIFLDKWFRFFAEYRENQTGALQRIIDGDQGIKRAVIVGDGVAYEIAEAVAEKVKEKCTLTRDVIRADLPSDTENNMSRIYMDNGLTESVQSHREHYLAAQNPDTDIDFMRLDEVTGTARPGEVLICTYKDIDDMGEKLQQKALKYFPETIAFFSGKIALLLKSGYQKVHLISDHGFVLTGLLEESDKIAIALTGEGQKAERYLRTVERQPGATQDLIELERGYHAFQYLYIAKRIAPFKTPGLYGFSHGGGTPQEVITPHFIWEKKGGAAAALSVSIDNKTDLKDVTGDLFSIRVKAEKGTDDLFAMERKVFLLFFADPGESDALDTATHETAGSFEGKTVRTKKQINKSDAFTIRRDEKITKEYTFDGHSRIDVQLLDAGSKQQIDKAVIRQNQDRDLGGLL